MKIELQVERLYNKGIDGKGSIGIVLGRLLFYKKGMIFNQLIIVLVIEFLSQNLCCDFFSFQRFFAEPLLAA